MRVLRAPLLLGAIFACCSAAAAAAPAVKLHLSGVLVQHSNGQIKQTPVQGLTLKAGDLVRYTIVATNVGTSPAFKLVPVGPIPQATSYVLQSARGDDAAVQYTLDGKSWSARPAFSVKTPRRTLVKAADPALYKAVRWIAPRALAPHKTQTFSYEVRVNGHPAAKKP